MFLIRLEDICLRFTGPPLLDHAELQIEPGQRLGLLGRNGSGKTSLLRIIDRQLEPDSGQIICGPETRVAMLEQDVPPDLQGSVYDNVAAGLGPRGQLLHAYHRASLELGRQPSDALHRQLDELHHRLDAEQAWQSYRQVERLMSETGLEPEAETSQLSAGLKRRVLLARALASDPDLVLLDEPTNHLDLAAIDWLEDFLLRSGKTLLMVTHDRVFLRRLTTGIVDLDRGRLKTYPCNYDVYVQRKQHELATEAQQWAEADKELAKEETWIRRTLSARRRRNQGRVRALVAMRQQRRERRQQAGSAKMILQEAERSGRLVIAAEKLGFAYAEESIVDNLSTAVMRGDRLGIIGPNGSGKTTLLRLLLGELEPNSGSVRHGTQLEIGYFDQLHAQLDDQKSVVDNVAGGNDSVVINGRKRHVIGYLQDFLFSPERARGLVKFLSGGERNRLLLARLFTRPTNLLVMDEPTNDLDLETLELLEELLAEYQGTLLLVSHDREFLNNVVTSTLVFEGRGQVREYDGGYDDWIRQRPAYEPGPSESKTAAGPIKATKPSRSKGPGQRRAKGLTYKEKMELEKLPEQIELLEGQLAELHELMADPEFYKQGGTEIGRADARLKTLQEELNATYARWESLEARAAGLSE